METRQKAAEVAFTSATRFFFFRSTVSSRLFLLLSVETAKPRLRYEIFRLKAKMARFPSGRRRRCIEDNVAWDDNAAIDRYVCTLEPQSNAMERELDFRVLKCFQGNSCQWQVKNWNRWFKVMQLCERRIRLISFWRVRSLLLTIVTLHRSWKVPSLENCKKTRVIKYVTVEIKYT